MRVFLDTNVLVSAFATRGLCADVVRLVLGEHELIISEEVLDELTRVLGDKLRVPAQAVTEIQVMLRAYHVEPAPSELRHIGLRDQTDEVILAAAIAAGAEVLVTEDKDLLEFAEQVRPIRITSPRQFWELVGKRESE